VAALVCLLALGANPYLPVASRNGMINKVKRTPLVLASEIEYTTHFKVRPTHSPSHPCLSDALRWCLVRRWVYVTWTSWTSLVARVWA
jgi:hypothetical protein